MSIWRSSETYVHHDPFNSVLRIGNVEVSEAVLEEMLEVAEFILFLRARASKLGVSWTVFKTTKRLEE